MRIPWGPKRLLFDPRHDQKLRIGDRGTDGFGELIFRRVVEASCRRHRGELDDDDPAPLGLAFEHIDLPATGENSAPMPGNDAGR